MPDRRRPPARPSPAPHHPADIDRVVQQGGDEPLSDVVLSDHADDRDRTPELTKAYALVRAFAAEEPSQLRDADGLIRLGERIAPEDQILGDLAEHREAVSSLRHACAALRPS